MAMATTSTRRAHPATAMCTPGRWMNGSTRERVASWPSRTDGVQGARSIQACMLRCCKQPLEDACRRGAVAAPTAGPPEGWPD
eukprot:7399310-Alexandrium_andersonii.AAC.1